MDLINVSLMKKNILWTMWELAIPHRNVLSVTNKLLLRDFRLNTSYLQMIFSGYLESLKKLVWEIFTCFTLFLNFSQTHRKCWFELQPLLQTPQKMLKEKKQLKATLHFLFLWVLAILSHQIIISFWKTIQVITTSVLE